MADNERDTDSMDIVPLFEFLYSKYKGDIDTICEWFDKHKFKCVPLFKDSSDYGHWFMISYIENCCTLWSTRWSRQCRGVFIFVNKESRAYCISRKLQRGAEMLTSLHLSSTGDKSIKTYHDFDQVQKVTMDALINNKKINGYLTSKVDGSLLGVTLFKKGTVLEKEIKRLIDTHADPFSKCIANIANQMKLLFLPIFSTQKTLFICDMMQSYVVTSLVAGQITDDELVKLAEKSKPVDVLEVFLPDFLKRLSNFYFNLPKEIQTDTVTLSFETICRNRMTAWGEEHTELAVAYDKSDLYFLGITYNIGVTSGLYIPHFGITNKIFKEPLWWNIKSGTTVTEMVKELDDNLTGKSVSNFIEKYPPENKSDCFYDCFYDYEGFVFFTDTSELKDATEKYDYSKIKTPTYYISHKYHDYNIKKLLALPEKTKNILPLVKEVRFFFLELPGKLITISENISYFLKDFITSIESNTVNSEFQTLFDSLPSGPKSGFIKRSDHILRMRILSANIDNLFLPFFRKEFPKLPQDAKIDDIMRPLILKIAPWDQKYKERINSLIASNDTVLCRLFDHLKTVQTSAYDSVNGVSKI